jgi:hypothetical protein
MCIGGNWSPRVSLRCQTCQRVSPSLSHEEWSSSDPVMIPSSTVTRQPNGIKHCLEFSSSAWPNFVCSCYWFCWHTELTSFRGCFGMRLDVQTHSETKFGRPFFQTHFHREGSFHSPLVHLQWPPEGDWLYLSLPFPVTTWYLTPLFPVYTQVRRL